MAFEVRYLPSAQQDLLDTVGWIAEQSPAKATAWMADLDKRIRALAELPESGRKPRNRRVQALGYRTLILGEYLVFYKIGKKEILIHRVLHGARNLSALI